MLYRNHEWIIRGIISTVTSAVMLNFYNDSFEVANLSIIEKSPEQGIIVSTFSFITDKNRQYPTRFYSLGKSYS